MKNHASDMRFNSSCQAYRLAKALKPGYILVDEMTFSDVLALAKDIASLINFYDHQNQHCGSYAPLFDNDVVIMALILSANPHTLNAQFQALGIKGEVAQALFIIDLYTDFDQWLKTLSQSGLRPSSALAEQLVTIIDKYLRQALKGVVHYLKKPVYLRQISVVSRKAINQKLAMLTPLWSVTDHYSVRYDRINAALNHGFYQYLDSITHLKAQTAQLLEQCLNSQQHEPTLGLLLVFIKLRAKIQTNLNQFTHRHRDFYYRTLLNAKPIHQVHQSVFLTFTVNAQDQAGVAIDRSIRFSTNAQKDIHFSSDTDLIARPVQVDSLYTLFLAYDPMISPERELAFVSGMKVHRLTHRPLQSKHAKPGSQPPGYDTIHPFGVNQIDNMAWPCSDALLGLGISSQSLLLLEGHRTITITLKLQDQLARPDKWAPYLAAINQAQKSEALEESVMALLEFLINLHKPRFKGTHGPLFTNIHVPKLYEDLAGESHDALLHYVATQNIPQLHLLFLLSLIRFTDQPEEFYCIFGLIVSRSFLFNGKSYLTPSVITTITERAQYLEIDHTVVCELLIHQGYYQNQLFSKLFIIHISTPEEFTEVTDFIVKPLDYSNTLPDQQQKWCYGVQCTLQLSPGFPDITPVDPKHHGAFDAHLAPMVKLLLNPEASIYPYDLFDAFALDKIDIDTQVRGLRDLILYNQQGRLNANQTFLPFGPLPTSQSYLILGAYELLSKNVQSVTMHLDWAELPTTLNGFSDHYHSYPGHYDNDCFKASFSFLDQGTWLPNNTPSEFIVNLFASVAGTLKSQHVVSMDLGNYGAKKAQDQYGFQPLPAQETFDYSIRSRTGFFQLSLSDPLWAFGHQQYTELLSQTLVANAKAKKPKDLPNSPYTPMLKSIVLDYTAKETLSLDQQIPRSKLHNNRHNSSAIYQLHPFGHDMIYPVSGQLKQEVFPEYQDHGYLFIGLSGKAIDGLLTLFVHLYDTAPYSLPTTPNLPTIHWYYLMSHGWVKLKSQEIISDTTEGFQISGIITLNLPPGGSQQHPLMPKGLYWLKISSRYSIQGHPPLHWIDCNALRVTAKYNSSTSKDESITGIACDSAWVTTSNVSGLTAIKQPKHAELSRINETEQRFISRMSERLRHKQRALTAWDYERLVLSEFPNIYRAKCFTNSIYDSPHKHPGHILLVLLQRPAHCQHLDRCNHRVSRDQLLTIKSYINHLAPGYVKIDVRNAVFEVVQVKLSVRINRSLSKVVGTRQLNQDLRDYLCPFTDKGNRDEFGWSLRADAVENYVGDLDYIDTVTGCSLIHILGNDQSGYALMDTASHSLNASIDTHLTPDTADTITPGTPWSIAVPTAQQLIYVMDHDHILEPEAVSVGELEIGNSFIVQGSSHAKA